MKKNTKFMLHLGMAVGTITVLNAITLGKTVAIGKKYKKDDSLTYDWVHGRIRYTCEGSGKPILLIHNINSDSSKDEWDKVVPILAGRRKVYTLDLLGCGKSSKPYITYRNSLFTGLICDFIRDIICENTDIACVGGAVTPVLSACAKNNSMIDDVILINPDTVYEATEKLTFKTVIEKGIIDLPVVGTLIYNMEFSKTLLKFKLQNLYFNNAANISLEDIDKYYYNAHCGLFRGKALFSSIIGRYLSSDIDKIASKLENRVLLLVGRNVYNVREVVKQYSRLFPDAKTVIINNTKIMMPLDNHLACANAILNF